MFKDEEDWNGLQTTNLRNLAKLFKMQKPWHIVVEQLHIEPGPNQGWFSQGVTKIRTTKLLIFLRFYFDDL